MIVKCIGLAGAGGVLSSVTAVFNAGGRLGFSAWADTFKDRNTIYNMADEHHNEIHNRQNQEHFVNSAFPKGI